MYRGDNKSCWYSTNSLFSFRRHTSRLRKGERGEREPTIAQFSATLEDVGVDVESIRVLEPTSLRVEKDNYVEFVDRKYQENVDTRSEEAKCSSKQTSVMQDLCGVFLDLPR